MSLIIDCHGHYTTAPIALDDWRNQQIAGIQDPAKMPKASDLKISDDDLRHSIETNQLKLMKERGSDITLFSPRASFMAHHIGAGGGVARGWDCRRGRPWRAPSPLSMQRQKRQTPLSERRRHLGRKP